MATLAIKDANDAVVFIEVAGSGTELDPYVPLHQVDNQITGFATDSRLELVRVLLETIKNWADTSGIGLKVSGFPTTQPISGSVSVSNFPADQTINGSVSVSNFPADQTINGSVSVSNQITGFATETTLDSYSKQSLGKGGIQYLDDNTLTNGNFIGFVTIAETTISAMTVTNSSSLPTGVAIPAGVTFMLPLTSITLTSGAVVLYKEPV